MSLFRRLLRAFLAPSDEYAASMKRAHDDLYEAKRREFLAHLEQMKSIKQKREEREIKSGIVIDPGGTCLCKRCGHTVSALHDSCMNCNAAIDWNA